MTRPWNPNRRLSDAEYRALTPAERRALFAARAEARCGRPSETTYERALRQHERRFRPTPSRYRKGYYARRRLWSYAIAMAAIFVGVPVYDWVTSGFAAPVDAPGTVAGGSAPVRASFAACKWGGGTNCVVDGDTFYLAGNKIRIAGIDAPETHDYGCAEELARGERAASRLQELLNAGAVGLSSIDRDRDRYGRLLRNAAVDGRDVGDTLVGEGLARPYAGGRRPWC